MIDRELTKVINRIKKEHPEIMDKIRIIYPDEVNKKINAVFRDLRRDYYSINPLLEMDLRKSIAKHFGGSHG